jgi:hypothetical protein
MLFDGLKRYNNFHSLQFFFLWLILILFMVYSNGFLLIILNSYKVMIFLLLCW